MELELVSSVAAVPTSNAGDLELAQRALSGDESAFERVMRRNNQRLYRLALSIVKNADDAKDVLQESYIRAFYRLASYQGKGPLGVWLARIVTNEALDRLRQRRARSDLLTNLEDNGIDCEEDDAFDAISISTMDTNPETSVNRAQLRTLLEDAILELPPTFRVVFMLREVEGLSVQEVATHLEIPLATVKTRAYRARQMLQRLLTDRVGGMFGELFAFLGTDCDGLTQSVLRRLRH